VSLVIGQTVDVAADAATVWRVITDVARYPEWNPFVVACRSTLAPGSAIVMRVRVLPFAAQPQRETVFAHVPGEHVSYGVGPLPFGLLASRRSHTVTALGPSRARYVSHFELSGRLAPVVNAVLGARLRAGFAAMTAALVTRAETLHAAELR
jgi:hypothetical protein